MAKQTYYIKAGSIPAICSVWLAGHMVADVVHLGDGWPDDYSMGPKVFIPEAVKKVVNEHYRATFAKGLEWLAGHYESEIRGVTVGSVQTNAAKNAPGTLVDVKFPDGWRWGYIVRETVQASDRAYRINVNSLSGDSVEGCAPECVRKSPRT